MIPRPLFDLLDGRRPMDAVVSFGSVEALSHARFRQRVAGLCQSLKGCRSAALVCEDSAAFAIGLFALLHAGADIVLPPNSRPATLETLTGEVERVIDDRAVWNAPLGQGELPPIPHDAAIRFFTSGSTGQPKQISRSLAMLEREAQVLESLWDQTHAASPVLSMVSHQHLYGLTFKILCPLAFGRPFHAGTHEVWESLLEAMPPQAMLVVSPAHLSRMGGLTPLTPSHVPSAVLSAGAPLPFEASRQAEAILHRRPTEIFGSTETGAVAFRRQAEEDQPWSLLPGHRLLDHDEGLLRLINPYDGQEIATADQIEPCDGGFRFLGRGDRIAKIAGKRVGLAEVESALAALPRVHAAAAVVLPDDSLAAVAVLTPEARSQLAKIGAFRLSRDLRRQLAASLDSAALPKRWRFVAELPHHPLGKSNNAALRALFAEEPAE